MSLLTSGLGLGASPSDLILNGLSAKPVPALPVSIAMAAAIIARGETASITNGADTGSARVLVSFVSADDLAIGINSTGAMMIDVIVAQTDYPGSTPSLGNTIQVTFGNGATKQLTVVERESDGRVFRHSDPAGEYLRIHCLVSSYTGV